MTANGTANSTHKKPKRLHQRIIHISINKGLTPKVRYITKGTRIFPSSC